MSETQGLPEALAEHGQVQLSGKEIGRLIGKVGDYRAGGLEGRYRIQSNSLCGEGTCAGERTVGTHLPTHSLASLLLR